MPGTGPQPSAVPIPASCTIAHGGAEAVAALKRVKAARPDGLPKSESATIPDGTCVTTPTVADWRAGGQFSSEWNTPIAFTTKFDNGTMAEVQKPDFPDQGPCGGTYKVKGDVVTFHWTKGGCSEIGDEVVRWSYYRGRRRFRIVDVADTASKVIYTAHAWRKID